MFFCIVQNSHNSFSTVGIDKTSKLSLQWILPKRVTGNDKKRKYLYLSYLELKNVFAEGIRVTLGCL